MEPRFNVQFNDLGIEFLIAVKNRPSLKYGKIFEAVGYDYVVGFVDKMVVVLVVLQ
jgi:hypothetical protein